MREKATLYLSTGAQEFWVVDPKQQTITIMRHSGGTQVYARGQSIPLVLFGTELSVSDIFA